MDSILQFDRWLFDLINHGSPNRVLDVLMPFITDFSHFRTSVIVMWAALLLFGGRKGRVLAVALAVVLLATDQLVSHVLKPMVGRQRPCAELEGVRLLVGFKDTLSFPSAHAANIFGSATLLSWGYRRAAPAFLLVALAVGYSRVYVGVHYPMDIVAGAIFGVAVGLGAAWVSGAVLRRSQRAAARVEAGDGAGWELGGRDE